MVSYDGAGSKGSQYAKLTKKDGTVKIISRNTNKVVSETNSKGNKVIRVDSKKNSRGGSGKTYTKVDSQITSFKQDQVNKARVETNNRLAIEKKNADAKQRFIDANKDLTAKQFFNSYSVNMGSDGSYSIDPRSSGNRPQPYESRSLRGGNLNPDYVKANNLFEQQKAVVRMETQWSDNKLIEDEALSRLMDKPKTASVLRDGGFLALTPEQQWESEFNPTLKTYTKENFKNIGKYHKVELPSSFSEYASGVFANAKKPLFSRLSPSEETRQEIKVQFKSMLTKEQAIVQGKHMAVTTGLNFIRTPVVGAGDVYDGALAIPDIAGGILFPTTQRKATAYLETADIGADIIPMSNFNLNFKSTLALSKGNVPLANLYTNLAKKKGGNPYLDFVSDLNADAEMKGMLPDAKFQAKGGSGIGGGSSVSSSTSTSTNKGLSVSSSGFANMNSNPLANMNFNPELNFNPLHANVNLNKELNFNINKNAEINFNPNANLNGELNINPNLNLNKEINLNKNLNINQNANMNANLNANVNANVNANLNANFNHKFNANMNFKFGSPRRKQSSMPNRYKFTLGKQGNKFFETFNSKDLLQGSSRSAKRIRSTVGASFKVTRKDGTALTVGERSLVESRLGMDFRRSNRDNRYIQKNRFRLSSKGETHDLKSFKNKSFLGSKTGFDFATKKQKEGFGLRSIRGFFK